MHRRISHTLNTLRQGLAAKLGGDFIDHACRLAGHSWCDSCLLTPAAIIHWSRSDPPRQHRLDTCLLVGWPAFTERLLPGPRPTPAGRLQTVLREMVKALVSATETVGRLARPSRLARRWLEVLHARHPRVAGRLRSARQPGRGCGFPVAKFLALFDLATGLLLRVFDGAASLARDVRIAGSSPCSRRRHRVG